MAVLRLILGDQLSHNIPTLNDTKEDDLVLMAELRDEATYVKHHKKKIAFIFSAMRHFADELKAAKLNLRYIQFNELQDCTSFTDIIKNELNKSTYDEVVVTEPGEYRLLDEFINLEGKIGIPVSIYEDNRFIATEDEFNQWASSKSKLIMENWYRMMRKKTGLLMDGNKPIGGDWNFDKQNRKSLKKDHKVSTTPLEFKPDKITRQVLSLVNNEFDDHLGDLEPFSFAVTSADARKALKYFIQHQLPYFGDYQDAMLSGEAFIYHSVISHYINCGLLDPLETCKAVEKAYHDGSAPINAVEGFIRQIIGWREFIRGVYWHYMPDYKEMNFLNARNPLPEFYWTGRTKMNCISEAINMTRRHAYSHHIQRLMVTGNFANLAGIDIQAICDWYLAVYADAYEWVELPNTLGMALYADGGLLGTKPYISTGKYIKRMSNFCDSCQYDPDASTGESACPFTTLYWNYLIRNEKKLRTNPRMALSYRNLDRLNATDKAEIQRHADFLITEIDNI